MLGLESTRRRKLGEAEVWDKVIVKNNFAITEKPYCYIQESFTLSSSLLRDYQEYIRSRTAL